MEVVKDGKRAKMLKEHVTLTVNVQKHMIEAIKIKICNHRIFSYIFKTTAMTHAFYDILFERKSYSLLLLDIELSLFFLFQVLKHFIILIIVVFI